MKIYLVDDNDKFRKTLKSFIEDFLFYQVVGESADGEHFVKNYNGNADIILMDINMPGIDGLKATKTLSNNIRNIKIIAVSQYLSMVDLPQLIGVGFKGFVSKTNLYEELDIAIQAVFEDGYYFPGDFSNPDKIGLI